MSLRSHKVAAAIWGIIISMKKAINTFYILAIGASIFFASWFVLHNTIYFHTDLARDFLLFEEIVVTKKPILIGPRTSMQGVFHGPLWLYVNLPVFLASKGNPVAQGWFWVMLIAASIGVVYWVSKKLVDEKYTLPATALYALLICSAAPYLYNPFGAVFFAPLFFYFFTLYMQKQKIKDLIITLLCIGMSIQFEMVWGVPILFLAGILILYKIIKKKKFVHLLSFGILTLPLSTFILFDIRHQFIQFKSVIRYVMGSPGGVKQQIDYVSLIGIRIKDMFLVIPLVAALLTVILLIVFFRTKAKNKYPYVGYFLYFYGGFWILTLPLRGIIYDYYYWAFLPLFCIVLGTLISSLFKKYSSFVFVGIILILLFTNIQQLIKQDNKFFSTNTGLWHFYYHQAQTIYKDAEQDFGWYVYTADQYAYSFKYAMSYVRQEYPAIKPSSFQKKPLTYLMIYPSDSKYTDENSWRGGQVKINKKPVAALKSMGGSYAEKYFLTQEEQAIQADSTLLQDLTFR